MVGDDLLGMMCTLLSSYRGKGVVGGSRNGLLTASGDGRKYFASNLGQSRMVNNKGGWFEGGRRVRIRGICSGKDGINYY